jgi:cytochrome o ubiquinol oxidase subunit 1
MGMTRRLQHYDVPEWRPWLIVAAFGALLILAGVVCQIIQLVVSIRERVALKDVTGDPWDGRSLEWATASPPPEFNFAVLPDVEGEDTYWVVKQAAAKRGALAQEPQYEDIEMPRNSPTGFVCAFFATLMGFALVWHIWWLFGAGFVGAYATFVVFAWRDVAEQIIPAQTVAEQDRAHRALQQQELAT